MLAQSSTGGKFVPFMSVGTGRRQRQHRPKQYYFISSSDLIMGFLHINR